MKALGVFLDTVSGKSLGLGDGDEVVVLSFHSLAKSSKGAKKRED